MSLLDKKNDLIAQMFLITKEALGFLGDESFDDLEKINSMLLKRQQMTAQIDDIDKQMVEKGESVDDNRDVKRSIELTIEGIISMDTSIAELIKKRLEATSSGLKDVRDEKKGLDLTRDAEIKGVNLDVSQ